MIDIETVVFDRVANAVWTYDKNANVTAYPVAMPESFPHVSLCEIDNTVYRRSQTLDRIENHAVLAYEVNVYSALATGRKDECKAIADVVDTAMSEMRFVRTFRGQTPNVDRDIYRITMRYSAVASQPITVGEYQFVNIYSE